MTCPPRPKKKITPENVTKLGLDGPGRAAPKWLDDEHILQNQGGKQLKVEIVVDRDAFEQGLFKSNGGYARFDKIFDGKLSEAVRFLTDGEAAAHDLGEASYPVITFLSMTAIFSAIGGDPDTAASAANRAVAAARALRAPSPLALSLYALGVATRDGDPAAALRANEESLELIRAGASDNSVGGVLHNIAQLRADAGDIAGAIAALRESIADYLRGISLSRATAPTHETFTLIPDFDPEAAAVLAGALIDGAFSSTQNMSTPRELHRQERALEVSRARLGPERFEAARARGATMTVVEVIELVRDVLDTWSPT